MNPNIVLIFELLFVLGNVNAGWRNGRNVRKVLRNRTNMAEAAQLDPTIVIDPAVSLVYQQKLILACFFVSQNVIFFVIGSGFLWVNIGSRFNKPEEFQAMTGVLLFLLTLALTLKSLGHWAFAEYDNWCTNKIDQYDQERQERDKLTRSTIEEQAQVIRGQAQDVVDADERTRVATVDAALSVASRSHALKEGAGSAELVGVVEPLHESGSAGGALPKERSGNNG